MSLKVSVDRMAEVQRALRKLVKDRVLVGIPADHAERQPDPDDPQPMNNAAIGYILDKGSPAANIPARPHMEPGIESVKQEIIERYRDGGKAILDGRITDPDKVHSAVGLIAEKGIKAKITEGDFVALAPSTIAARKRRGRKSEKPLADTGQYRRAITHVIRPAGGGKG